MHFIVNKNDRHRYIYFIVKSKNKQLYIEKSDFYNEIKQQCRKLFNKNCEDMGLYLISFNGKKGIIKCNHIQKENTIKLLNSIKKVLLNEIEIRTIGTSGTIKTLTKKYIKNNHNQKLSKNTGLEKL
ncbi:MAG: Rpp14/Pop5 family protein [Candidatus Thermoplasmatota archaeon]|nr:Rpp14/Pop5 family protein [Candidatus Thermoplasmatota archaeon]